MKRSRVALASVVLLLVSPAVVSCGGESARDSCVSVAAERAAELDGVEASSLAGDYDLASLCDTLGEQFKGDAGRVEYAVNCVADYVESNLEGDGVFSTARSEGAGAPDLMDDPVSVGACM